MRPSFFHHLHPPTIPARQSRLRYTLGAGGLSVYLVIVLLLTGALLMFYYVPTPEGAGPSIQAVTFLVPYGTIIRNLHYWAAQLLVIVAAVHMLRVIFTGAYAAPRRFNYLLGLTLLVLSLFLDFTGYVLRWDEGVRWALVAGTNLVKSIPRIGPTLYLLVMGGSKPNPATLVRFYAWHIFGLTIFLVGIGVWHLFKVRRFELVRREGLAAIIATIVLILLAAFIPAPLASPMSDVGQAVDSRAPWFFLWVQQMLKSGNAFIFGVLVPLGALLLLALLPYLLPNARPEELGRWLPRSSRLAQWIVLGLVLGIIALTIMAIIPSS
jgi:quinol-cytochrome oxidoreductase complex cytochrome b subunit